MSDTNIADSSHRRPTRCIRGIVGSTGVSLSISQGDPKIFVTHGISAVLLGLTVVILIAPLAAGYFKRRRNRDKPLGATGEVVIVG